MNYVVIVLVVVINKLLYNHGNTIQSYGLHEYRCVNGTGSRHKIIHFDQLAHLLLA